MAFVTYDLLNKKRDLRDTLSTIIAGQPRFISNFPTDPEMATNQKSEWLEDQITGRSVAAVSVAGNVVTLSAADAKRVLVGTLIAPKDDSALFRVTAVGATSATVEFVAANGSSVTAVTGGMTLNIVSTPMPMATGNGDGEQNYHQVGVGYNVTQILRKDIIIARSTLSTNVYGNVDNTIARQTAFALSELARDLNRTVLYGRRVEWEQGVIGEMGGLYFFGTQPGGLAIDASGAILDSYVINDGAQAVLGEGAAPSQILCSPGQARVISNEYKDRLQIMRQDDARGAFVAVIINEINGTGMTIIADPDMPDTDAWVLDTGGFALRYLQGSAFSDEDATTKGFDGIKRIAIGEATFVFRNPKQRLCRISNLKPSAAALAEIKARG